MRLSFPHLPQAKISYRACLRSADKEGAIARYDRRDWSDPDSVPRNNATITYGSPEMPGIRIS